VIFGEAASAKWDGEFTKGMDDGAGLVVCLLRRIQLRPIRESTSAYEGLRTISWLGDLFKYEVDKGWATMEEMYPEVGSLAPAIRLRDRKRSEVRLRTAAGIMMPVTLRVVRPSPPGRALPRS